MTTYTTTERAQKIYNTVVDIFDWRQSSDCVTPFALVTKQFDGVDLGETVCIPGAGIGTYVLAAIQKGFKPENIYAVELNQKYYELGSAMFERLGVNYFFADFLTWNPQMQFDVVIGNPPYQGGSFDKKVYKSLWPKFWSKAFELVKDDGFVSLITPLTWCSPTSDLAKCDAIGGETRLWNVFQKFTSVADVTTIKDFFPGVGSTFSLVTVNKSGTEGLTFTDGYQPSLGFYPLSGADVVTRELSLTDNISSTFSWKDDSSPWRVSIVKSRKVCEVNVEVCGRDEAPVSNLPESLYAYVYCPTQKQAEYVRARILECRDVLYKHCRYNGFIDLRITGMISLNKEEL